jgi:hypothetical protein
VATLPEIGGSALHSSLDAIEYDGVTDQDLKAGAPYGTPAPARWFRAVDAGDLTFTTVSGREQTWSLTAGEGYSIQVIKITFAGKIRVGW